MSINPSQAQNPQPQVAPTPGLGQLLQDTLDCLIRGEREWVALTSSVGEVNSWLSEASAELKKLLQVPDDLAQLNRLVDKLAEQLGTLCQRVDKCCCDTTVAISDAKADTTPKPKPKGPSAT